MRLCLGESTSASGRTCECFGACFYHIVPTEYVVCRVLAAQFAGIGLAFKWPALNSGSVSFTLPKRAQYTIQYTLALLSALSLLATLYHTPSVVPKPHRPGPRIVRAGIWTVHFGIDNRGRDSQRLMRDLIR